MLLVSVVVTVNHAPAIVPDANICLVVAVVESPSREVVVEVVEIVVMLVTANVVAVV